MAKPDGFICDSCKTYTDPEHRTKQTVRWEGSSIDGHTIRELCPECTPKAEEIRDFKPTRHRKTEVTSSMPIEKMPTEPSEAPTKP